MSRVLGAQEYTTRKKNKVIAQTFYSNLRPVDNQVYTSFVANHATQVVQVLEKDGWYTYSERCGVRPTYWNPVFGGPPGSIASAIEVSGSQWDLSGPNNNDMIEEPGWTYIYRYFPVSATFTYDYDWSTIDEEGNDWPFEYITTLSGGFEAGLDAYMSDDTNTYITDPFNEQGSRTVTVPSCSTLIVGVYSRDSVGGPGVLNLTNLPYSTV
jgi:hypothetical protein